MVEPFVSGGHHGMVETAGIGNHAGVGGHTAGACHQGRHVFPLEDLLLDLFPDVVVQAGNQQDRQLPLDPVPRRQYQRPGRPGKDGVHRRKDEADPGGEPFRGEHGADLALYRLLHTLPQVASPLSDFLNLGPERPALILRRRTPGVRLGEPEPVLQAPQRFAQVKELHRPGDSVLTRRRRGPGQQVLQLVDPFFQEVGQLPADQAVPVGRYRQVQRRGPVIAVSGGQHQEAQENGQQHPAATSQHRWCSGPVPLCNGVRPAASGKHPVPEAGGKQVPLSEPGEA